MSAIFFAEGESYGRVLEPITPGKTELFREAAVSLPRIMVATCAADDTWALIESFRTTTIGIEVAAFPVEIPEAEIEIDMDPGDEVTLPIVTAQFGAGELLFRMDKTKRIKRMRRFN